MYQLYLHKSWEKPGGALFSIVRLIRHYYKIKCRTWNGEKSGVYLGTNVLPGHISDNIRKVLFVAGPGRIGIPKRTNWNKCKHIVFVSHFFRRIAKSQFDIKNASVIHLVGGVPSDKNMQPKTSSNSMSSGINFTILAKWWKRPFKRQRQSLKLFKNFILPKYPNAYLHVLGNNINDKKREGHIIFYPKSFHNNHIIEVFSKSHIQIILTPFDTAPTTLTESLHYRLPFICSNNTSVSEIIGMIDGKCGEIVKIDPVIKTKKQCLLYKPMTNRKFYNRELDYKLIMSHVSKIIDNYNEYTSWNWTKEFNYAAQAEKWMKVLFA